VSPATGLSAISRDSAAVHVAREIRNAILSGRLPHGTRLREQKLSEELGVSRGPIREALQRLVQEGLAVAEPNRGVYVAQISSEDLADVFVARVAIEETAAAVIASRRDSEDLAGISRLRTLVGRMREAALGGKWSQVTDRDLRFHEALVEMSRSARLKRGFSTLSAETRIGVARQVQQYPDPLAIVAEHEDIVRALEDGSPSQIRDAIRRHMIVSIRNLGIAGAVPPLLTDDVRR